MPFSAGDTKVQPPAGTVGIVLFAKVRAEDLTPSLTIVITAVNGIPSRDINTSGYMKIDTGDLQAGAARLAQEQQRKKAATAEAGLKALSVIGIVIFGAVFYVGLPLLIIYLIPGENAPDWAKR
jgi:hypothetical protein